MKKIKYLQQKIHSQLAHQHSNIHIMINILHNEKNNEVKIFAIRIFAFASCRNYRKLS